MKGTTPSWTFLPRNRAPDQAVSELFTGKSDALFFDGFYPAVLDNVLGLKQGFKSVDRETGDYGSSGSQLR